MAVSKLWPVTVRLATVLDYASNPEKTTKSKSKYSDADYQALRDVVAYAKDGEKTERELFCEGIHCNPQTAREQFITVKEQFDKPDGIQAYHGYLSFEETECDYAYRDELRKLAQEKGWPTYSVPDGVGGRFSIFCDVGLTVAACVGFDIRAFLDGAKAMDKACQQDDLWQNPAMLNAALKFIASEKYGRDMEVMMPYGDYLKSVSEWYIQLLAESLGKQVDREGKEVCYGRTPIVAVGTRDMHSMTQQHQEGRLNKVIQFLKVKNWKHDYKIPNVFPEAKKLADIAGVTMSDALETARQSNADALTGNHRYNATFTLPELNAYHLGELLYMLAMSIAYEGELADVDAFNQPGVEAYKKIMWPRLNELKKELE